MSACSCGGFVSLPDALSVNTIDGRVIELTIGILIERTDPDVTNALANQSAAPPRRYCQGELYDLSLLLSIIPKTHPSLPVLCSLS
jgi:hypothetical protein